MKFANSCYYMSSTPKIHPRYCDCFGIIISVQTAPRPELMKQYPWCLDNDAFNGKFRFDIWCDRLISGLEFISTCAFVVCPDKVFDHVETLRRFAVYFPIIKGCGYPVAFVTQDGLMPELVPWDQLDVLFVGGSDQHKLGREAGVLIAEAKKKNKWVHVGRVNSPSRMRQFWIADSWDGTTLNYEPDNRSPKIAACVREIREWKRMEKLF